MQNYARAKCHRYRRQDSRECQLVVEQKPSDPYTYVVAEIYSDKLATLYNLMWAK